MHNPRQSHCYSGQYPSRKPLRLPGYDYGQPGYYFVTICIQDRKLWLGSIPDTDVLLTHAGNIVQSIWTSLPGRFIGVELDQYVIMPNHIHGIVLLTEEVRYCNVVKKHRLTLSDIIGKFKGATTYQLHIDISHDFEWQRSYHDIIIKSDRALDYLRRYISNNPRRWKEDTLYTP